MLDLRILRRLLEADLLEEMGEFLSKGKGELSEILLEQHDELVVIPATVADRVRQLIQRKTEALSRRRRK